MGFETGSSAAAKERQALVAIKAAEDANEGPLSTTQLFDAMRGRKQTKEQYRASLAAAGLIENLKPDHGSATAPDQWTVTEKGRELYHGKPPRSEYPAPGTQGC